MRAIAVLTTLTACLFLTLPAPAQQERPPGGAQRLAPGTLVSAPGHAATEGPVVSVDFPGGTIAEYVVHLRGAAEGEPVNIVLSPAAAELRLPPMQIEGVTLLSALRALERVASVPAASRLRIDALHSDLLVITEGRAAAFAVRIEDIQQGFTAAKQAAQIVEVISLREVVRGPGGIDAQIMLAAVREALQLQQQEGAPAAQVRFHVDSGLLIVRGTPEQVQVVRDVVSRLEASVLRERLQADVQHEQVRNLRHDVDRADAELRLEQSRVKVAQAEFAVFRAMQEQGMDVPSAQMAKGEHKVESAQIGVELAARQLEHLRERLRAAEAGAGQGPAEPARRGPPDRPEGPTRRGG